MREAFRAIAAFIFLGLAGTFVFSIFARERIISAYCDFLVTNSQNLIGCNGDPKELRATCIKEMQ